MTIVKQALIIAVDMSMKKAPMSGTNMNAFGGVPIFFVTAVIFTIFG